MQNEGFEVVHLSKKELNDVRLEYEFDRAVGQMTMHETVDQLKTILKVASGKGETTYIMVKNWINKVLILKWVTYTSRTAMPMYSRLLTTDLVI